MINMKKVWRAELRGLVRQKRTIIVALRKVAWTEQRAIKEHQANFERANHRANKQIQRLNKRRAVLEGRLS